MRSRPLRQDNPIIRATGFADLSVTAGEVFDQAAQAPGSFGLLRQRWNTVNSFYDSLTPEEKEKAREMQRTVRLQRSDLESQLDLETDEIRKEQISLKLDDLYKQENTYKDTMIQQMLDDGRLRSPENLQEQYGDIIEFTEPMSTEKAKLLVENKKEALIRDAIISQGLTGIPGYAAMLSGSLLAAAVDPIEAFAAVIPYFGPARRASVISRLGRVRGRAAIGSAEALAGSLATEPIYFGLSQQQQLDYTMGDALFNVGIGTLLGTGIGTIRGLATRRDIDVDAIIRDTELKPEDVYIPERIGPDDPLEFTKRFDENNYRNVNLLGGSDVSRLVLAQFQKGMSVNVAPVLSRATAAPEPLNQFVKRKGGIRDLEQKDANELQRGKFGVEREGKYISSINNPEGLSLFEMTRQAYREGYLEEQNVQELVQKLKQNEKGNYTFRQGEEAEANDWRALYKAKDDIEAEIAAREDIKIQVKDLTGADVTDREANLIYNRMQANKESVFDAAQAANINLRDAQLKAVAINAQDTSTRVGNDELFSREADEELKLAQDDFDLDGDLAEQEQMYLALKDQGELTTENLEIEAQFVEIDQVSNAASEAADRAARCVAS
jgi:hypothetical protein